MSRGGNQSSRQPSSTNHERDFDKSYSFVIDYYLYIPPANCSIILLINRFLPSATSRLLHSKSNERKGDLLDASPLSNYNNNGFLLESFVPRQSNLEDVRHKSPSFSAL